MKRLSSIILSLLLIFSLMPIVEAEGQEENVFRVGMECAYAPYNWTQNDDSNGAVKIEGSEEYANGYDVKIAKIIAEGLNKELVIVKTEWDGLPLAVQSGKVDAIIAGMSPTAERKEQIDFTDTYYNSDLVLVTMEDNPFVGAKTKADLKNAKVVGQLNTFHDTVIDQIPGVDHLIPMADFATMRVALESGKVDAYVTERPEAISAIKANGKFHILDLEDGFETEAEDTAIAIGVKKGSELKAEINEILAPIDKARQEDIMDQVIDEQLGLGGGIWSIFTNNKLMFAKGVKNTLLISLVGTFLGLMIGLLIGIVRTIPDPNNPVGLFFLKLVRLILNIYIQVFRGTPMIVQSMLFYYGLQQFFNIDMSPMASAFIIVSVNTGAYMAEVVRGGIMSIEKGQYEAASAIGMTHFQTMFYVVIPQAMKNILPATGNEFIVNIKDTSVLNVISVTELFFTTKSIAGANFRYFETYAITSLIYLILTLSIAGILHLIERKLSGPDNYKKVRPTVLKSSN